MTRYGAQFGPDITFLGVDPVDLETRRRWRPPTSWSSGRRSTAGRRTGPAPGSGRRRSGRPDYLPHDGSRPHLALRVDALQDVRVVDAGDVEMPPGEIETCTRTRSRRPSTPWPRPAPIPLVLGGDHSIALPTRPAWPGTSASARSR